MADQKLSALPAGAAVVDGDLFYVAPVAGGQVKQLASAIKSYVLTGLSGGGNVTAAGTLTDHALVVGDGTTNVAVLAVLTNGQLAIGSTGADPVPATLTAGTGITITNGVGSISVAGAAGGTPRSQRLISTGGAVTPNATTDQIITFNVTAGTAPSYVLPTAAARNAVASGAPITFKDIGGGFALFNLTITPTDNIEGSAAAWVLSNNYAGVTLYPRTDGSAGWFVL